MDFKPDDRKVTYRLFTQEKKVAPNIIFSVTALKWIRALIEAHTTEVGFYAIIDEQEEYTYYIRDIFYPKHCAADGGTCEISPEGETEVMEYLCDKGREEEIPFIRFWGHYHPQGFTTPSGQDETQAFDRMNSTQAYLIRAICSDNEISISFFDYQNQIRFDNIKWTVEENASKNAMIQKLDDIKELVTPDYSEDPYDVIARVYSIFKHDQEMEEIEQKVKKLKEKNIPTRQYHCRSGSHSYHHGHQQGNLFDYSGSTNVTTTKVNKKQEDDDSSDSILSEAEIATLMTDVEKQIEEFETQSGSGG